ncbi:hypothetical protein CKM354_001148100 [Cercospora kikuchii]|uniref:DUF2786 domain-containing protein n=1 Tax=Cercospora kikuchii TaxID=84275 RepID=A0A9P3FLA2_9PEZI|nr:uncharacterized protein CKM354_001148100 [Cercospora kikuchii]GIZ48420.1 hypothetical protein CKM354_001148100 [Cercospora kikuchii]
MATDAQATAHQAIIDAAVKAALASINGGGTQQNDQEILRATTERVRKAVEDAAAQVALATASTEREAERLRSVAREKSLKDYIAIKTASLDAADRKAEAKAEEARTAAVRAEHEKTLMDWKATKSNEKAAPYPANLAAVSADFRATLTGDDHEMADATGHADSEQADQVTVNKRRKKCTTKGPKLGAPPLYKAQVIDTADNDVRVMASTDDIAQNILERIKKCLASGNHPHTPEAEAKRALHIASRLMKQYNVTQAEVLAHTTPEQQLQLGGCSVVSIVRNDGNLTKNVQQQIYIGELAYAMEDFFNVKFFTGTTTINYSPFTRGLNITFYGVAANTVAAANAFEMTHNLMVEWARKYSGVVGRSSYCLGICDELRRAAEQEKKEEMERAKEAEAKILAFRIQEEEAQCRAKISRLNGPDMDDSTASSIAPPRPTVDDMAEDETEEGYLERISAQTVAPTHVQATIDADRDDVLSIATYSDWSGIDDDVSMGEADDGVMIDDDNVYVKPDVEDDERIHLPSDFSASTNGFWNDLLGSSSAKQGSAKAPPYTTSSTDQDDEEICYNEEAAKLQPSAQANHTKIVDLNEQEGGDTTSEPSFANPSQLIKFIEKANQIADDQLKQMGIKISTGRTHKWKAFDQEARKGGRIDGKKIHPKVKTLKPAIAAAEGAENGADVVMSG